MAKLPVTVTSALRRSQEPETDHPDANVLAAFNCNTLSRSDRSLLLRHLSQCAACREVVALTASTETRSSKLLWWTIPLAAGAGGAFLLAISVWLHVPTFPDSKPTEKQIISATGSSGTAAQDQALNVPSQPLVAYAPRKKPAVKKRKALPVQVESPAQANIHLPLPSDAEPSFQRPMAETVSPALTLNFAERANINPTAAFARAVDSGPVWSLSTEPSKANVLLRSFDNGHNWQEVVLDPQAHLTALLAQGADVWVGGFGGMLWHSIDFGVRWSRIEPKSETGAPLRDTIRQIASPAPDRLEITLDSGDRWLTADDGLTWQRVVR